VGNTLHTTSAETTYMCSPLQLPLSAPQPTNPPPTHPPTHQPTRPPTCPPTHPPTHPPTSPFWRTMALPGAHCSSLPRVRGSVRSGCHMSSATNLGARTAMVRVVPL
jgi:hypothetical protein